MTFTGRQGQFAGEDTPITEEAATCYRNARELLFKLPGIPWSPSLTGVGSLKTIFDNLPLRLSAEYFE